MRYCFYFGCWFLLTSNFVKTFDATWDLFWLLPSLVGVGAMLFCIIQYNRHPETHIYLGTIKEWRDSKQSRSKLKL